MWDKIKSIFRDKHSCDSVIVSSKKENASSMSHRAEIVDSIQPQKMTLSKAFTFLINNYGIECFLGSNLVSILNDLTDYEGNRAAKSLLREFVVNHTLSEFITRCDSDSLERVRQKALIEYGFNERITEYVISSIAEATGISIVFSEDEPIENKAPKNEPSPSCHSPQNVSYIIQFMGLHLGAHVSEFNNVLKSKGFRCKYKGRFAGLVSMYKEHGGDMSDYDLVDWEEYEGQFADQDCMSLVLFATPITHRVYRVDVKMRYSGDSDRECQKYIYPCYTFFYDLLTSKYGTPINELPVDLSLGACSNEGKGLTYNDGETTLTLTIEQALPFTNYFQVVLRYSSNNVPTLTLEKRQQQSINIANEQAHRQQLMSDV